MIKITNKVWYTVILTMLMIGFITTSEKYGYEGGIEIGHYYWAYMLFIFKNNAMCILAHWSF